MNLTVKALREAEGTCEQLLTLDLVKTNETLTPQLEELQAGLKGCLSMLNDLDACSESLQKAGFSDEWFQIMNKDNRLLTVCNIEMPKFFGDDNTKYQACMEGIMDTIRTWIIKIWNFIKKCLTVAVQFVRTLNIFWHRQSASDPAVRRKLEEWCEKIDTAQNQGVDVVKCVVKIKKMDAIARYISALNKLIECINHYGIAGIVSKWSVFQPGDPADPTPNDMAYMEQGKATADVYGHLANLASGCLLPIDKVNEVGFAFKQNDMEFVDTTTIPEEDICVVDPNQFKTRFVDFREEIVNHSKQLTSTLDGFQRQIGLAQKAFEHDRDDAEAAAKQFKAWGMDNHANVKMDEKLQAIRKLQRCSVLASVIAKLSKHYGNLSMAFNSCEVAVHNKMNEAARMRSDWLSTHH